MATTLGVFRLGVKDLLGGRRIVGTANCTITLRFKRLARLRLKLGLAILCLGCKILAMAPPVIRQAEEGMANGDN